MKYVMIIGLLLSLSLHAEEIEDQETITEPSVQELIEQVKNAPDDEKRVLMNQLKVHLKSMNKENRKKAMMKIKSSFAKSESTPHQEYPESYQQGKHQPKFRHLHRSSQNAIGTHQGQGANRQGNGQK